MGGREVKDGEWCRWENDFLLLSLSRGGRHGFLLGGPLPFGMCHRGVCLCFLDGSNRRTRRLARLCRSGVGGRLTFHDRRPTHHHRYSAKISAIGRCKALHRGSKRVMLSRLWGIPMPHFMRHIIAHAVGSLHVPRFCFKSKRSIGVKGTVRPIVMMIDGVARRWGRKGGSE